MELDVAVDELLSEDDGVDVDVADEIDVVVADDVDDDVCVVVDVAVDVAAAAVWHMYDACTCATLGDTTKELLLMDGQYRRAKPPLD